MYSKYDKRGFMLKIYDVLNNKFKDINNFDEWVEHLKELKPSGELDFVEDCEKVFSFRDLVEQTGCENGKQMISDMQDAVKDEVKEIIDIIDDALTKRKDDNDGLGFDLW